MSIGQGKSRILIIEDDVDIQDLLSEFLKHELRAIVYQIDVVSNAKQAVQMLAQFNYHLLISDYQYPEGGFQFVYETIKRQSLLDLQMILLSGGVDLHALPGIDDVTLRLEKPIDLKKLAQYSEEALAKQKAPFEPPRKFRRYSGATIELVTKDGSVGKVLDISVGGFRVVLPPNDLGRNELYTLIRTQDGQKHESAVIGDIVWTKRESEGVVHGIQVAAQAQKALREVIWRCAGITIGMPKP